MITCFITLSLSERAREYEREGVLEDRWSDWQKQRGGWKRKAGTREGDEEKSGRDETAKRVAEFISHNLSLNGGQMLCSQPEKYIMEINISTLHSCHNPTFMHECTTAS